MNNGSIKIKNDTIWSSISLFISSDLLFNRITCHFSVWYAPTVTALLLIAMFALHMSFQCKEIKITGWLLSIFSSTLCFSSILGLFLRLYVTTPFRSIAWWWLMLDRRKTWAKQYDVLRTFGRYQPWLLVWFSCLVLRLLIRHKRVWTWCLSPTTKIW